MNQSIVQIDTRLLSEYFKEEYKIEKLPGLTNFVYKISSSQKAIIYRIFTNYFAPFQNRQLETKLQERLSQLDLAPQVLYVDNVKRIEEWKPWACVSCLDLKKDFLKIANLIGKVHSTNFMDIINQDPYTHSDKIQQNAIIKRHIENQQVKQIILEEILQKNENKFLLKVLQLLVQDHQVFQDIFQDKVQQKIQNLFENPSLHSLPLILAHNDLNSTNFLRKEDGSYFLIDWENAGPNYPGYDIANFFNEMNWDYTFEQWPNFKVSSDILQTSEKQLFLQEYWSTLTALNQRYPVELEEQVRIGGILQNYFWMLIGVLSLQFAKSDLSIDLFEYIKTRIMILEKDLNISLLN